ncbi:MAG: alpha/beta fold hydrolase [Candidatus Berkiella sp.]
MHIVLVHGAWHTASCWKQILKGLQTLGTVHAINMPGRIFENSSTYKRLTLNDYVTTLENYLKSIGEPCIVIGHSLAGLTISQVAENQPHLIKQLIYIAAFIPQSDECLFDMAATIGNPGISTEAISYPALNKIEIKRSDRAKSLIYNSCPPILAEKELQSMVPEPLKAFSTKVRSLSPQRFGSVSKTYIKCLEDRIILPYDQERMIQRANISHVYELKTDHCPFFGQPEALVDVLKQSIQTTL